MQVLRRSRNDFDYVPALKRILESSSPEFTGLTMQTDGARRCAESASFAKKDQWPRVTNWSRIGMSAQPTTAIVATRAVSMTARTRTPAGTELVVIVLPAFDLPGAATGQRADGRSRPLSVRLRP